VTSAFPRLSAADLTNLAVEAADTPMHVGVLAILDGWTLSDADERFRLAAIRTEIDGRLTGVPELRRIVHGAGPLAGAPLWVDDPSFRIDRHVHQVVLAPPADEAALLRMTEELMAPTLDRTHPMWRIWFVTGLPGHRVAAVIALHHAMTDGLGAVQLLTALLDLAPTAKPQPWAPSAPPRWRTLARDNVRVKLVSLRRLIRAPHPHRLVASVLGGWRGVTRAWHAPRTSLTGPIGPRRRLAVLRLDLATVRQVAHDHHGKVNDVVLDLAAGGLRALLLSRAESVDRLAVHAAVAASPHTDTPAPRTGNRAGIIIVNLPLDEPDPSARLWLIGLDSARAKREQLLTTEQGMLVWLARLGLLRRYTRRQRLTNIAESSVIGPPTPIRLLGAPVTDMIPIGALAGNLAISFLAFSYAGRLTIAIRADADRHPDLAVLTDAMARDWQVLTSAPRPTRT